MSNNAFPLPFPWLSDPEVQQNFDALAVAVGGLFGGQTAAIRFGSTSQVMPAATSGTFNVTHGLGTTPVVAFAIANGANANDLTIGTSGYGATTFTVAWRRASGVNPPSPITFYWLAIG